MQACLSDQQAAREQLARERSRYPGGEKSARRPIAASGYLPNYVEPLTCLQIFRFARNPSLYDWGSR